MGEQKPTVRDKLTDILAGVRDVAGKAWDELAPVVAHGSAEVMAAAYTGNGYVMYGHSDVSNDLSQHPPVAPEHDHGMER